MSLEMYAALGLNVIPLIYRDKRPALGSWAEYQERQSTDAERAEWFSRKRNVGVVCGSISDLLVVDCDNPEVYAALVAAEPAFERAMRVRTGRGVHIYLRPEGDARTMPFTLCGVTNHLKGDGGYVVAAPSVHPSGARYELELNEGPLFYDVEQLLALLRGLGATFSAIPVTRRASTKRARYPEPDPSLSIAELYRRYRVARGLA